MVWGGLTARKTVDISAFRRKLTSDNYFRLGIEWERTKEANQNRPLTEHSRIFIYAIPPFRLMICVLQSGSESNILLLNF